MKGVGCRTRRTFSRPSSARRAKLSTNPTGSPLRFSSHRSHRPHQLHSPSAFWSDVGRFAFVVWAKGKGGEEEALWGSLEWRVSGAKREGHSVDHPPAGGRDCPRTQQVRVYRFL